MDDILFIDGNKAYVGVEHGKKANLSPEDARKLARIAEQYGAYYEGTGGDVSALGAVPRSMYRGSWDDLMQKDTQGYPPEYLYTLFTNVDVNKQADILPAANKTIFESILAAQDKVSALKGRNFDADVLRQFLQSASENDADLLRLAQQPATEANVRQFLRTGEQLMWPEDKEEYSTKAGQLAKKVNDLRQRFLAQQPSGVFVMGSDHVSALRRLANERNAQPEEIESPFYRDPFELDD
jgi:hypothetical protein